jgi:hypothetical protein
MGAKMRIHITVINVGRIMQLMIKYKQFKFIDFMILNKNVLIDALLEKN